MATDPISGLEYPASTSAPAGAAQLMALALSGRGKTIRTAVDEADRDALYGAGGATVVPDGQIVVAPTVSAMWLKTPTRWATLFQSPRIFTPQVQDSAGGVVASSVSGHSYYEIVNDVVHATASRQLDADVEDCYITLPVTSAHRLLACGVCALFGTGTPSDQTSIAYMADTTRLVVTAFTQGYRGGVAGNIIRYDVHYPLV